jgi:2-hydroxy-3-keto-5-methylthiopentenyl-1-phosphate phosphatase
MKKETTRLSLANCQVFFDFDNTITSFDVLDDIIRRFAVNKDWMKAERDWQRGKIGSRECLKRQMKLVKVDKERLLDYLSEIKVDPYFKKILLKLKAGGVKPVIVSDSFSFIINNILRNNAISGVKVYSNRLNFSQRRLWLSFPHRGKKCCLCAHCKKNSLLRNGKDGKIKIYVGDGASDLCAAMHADLVFAKGRLKDYLSQKNKSCIPIKTLKEVYFYFNGAKDA